MIANVIYDCDCFGDSITIDDPDDLTKDHKLMILHGGEDISPSIYDEKAVYTHAGNVPSYRDSLEIAMFNRAIELNIPVLGICRGAQLVCALLGGKLYQDVSGHTGYDHYIHLEEDPSIKFLTNSYHHQMMIPKDGHLLAYHGPRKAMRKTEAGPEIAIIKEPEVVHWKDARVLAVQGHPEWDRSNNGIFHYTNTMLHKLFGV